MVSENAASRWAEFKYEVLAAKRVLIGTHLNPDGDAIGSALATSHVLDGLGIANDVVTHDAPPNYLGFLPGIERVGRESSDAGFDLGIALDLDSLERLGSLRATFEALPRLILVDHHIPHEAPGNVRIVDTTAPATAAILADLFSAEPEIVDRRIAQCLLTGLVTDTGGFRFPNTSAHSLAQAAWLIERGGDLPQVMAECFLQRDEQAVRLMGAAIQRMKMDCGGRLAWAALPAELYQSLGARDEHTEGIVNELLSVRTVQVAAVLRPGKHGRVKGSLRSKGSLDVAAVARQIGGGGHKNAAGLTYDGSLEDAERDIIDALKQCLASSSSTSPKA
ncbi:MAG: bifunctional oligoribonuclease/PAP phosphatase NrnA [Fimbriimonadaceae bacterium]|nr:bifunctional oligoribonuclease/PAP phosphatase NrnA [Fimbriimonadaceae bacterium]QYK56986.1 MAG: bifunctional oligoribonuclease/PAP phosphatase NrnA [Fimbriimonadaceae bacterium]